MSSAVQLASPSTAAPSQRLTGTATTAEDSFTSLLQAAGEDSRQFDADAQYPLPDAGEASFDTGLSQTITKHAAALTATTADLSQTAAAALTNSSQALTINASQNTLTKSSSQDEKAAETLTDATISETTSASVAVTQNDCLLSAKQKTPASTASPEQSIIFANPASPDNLSTANNIIVSAENAATAAGVAPSLSQELSANELLTGNSLPIAKLTSAVEDGSSGGKQAAITSKPKDKKNSASNVTQTDISTQINLITTYPEAQTGIANIALSAGMTPNAIVTSQTSDFLNEGDGEAETLEEVASTTATIDAASKHGFESTSSDILSAAANVTPNMTLAGATLAAQSGTTGKLAALTVSNTVTPAITSPSPKVTNNKSPLASVSGTGNFAIAAGDTGTTISAVTETSAHQHSKLQTPEVKESAATIETAGIATAAANTNSTFTAAEIASSGSVSTVDVTQDNASQNKVSLGNTSRDSVSHTAVSSINVLHDYALHNKVSQGNDNQSNVLSVNVTHDSAVQSNTSSITSTATLAPQHLAAASDSIAAASSATVSSEDSHAEAQATASNNASQAPALPQQPIVHNAHLASSTIGSEVRIGMQTPELGRVEVHANLRDSSVGASITVERAEVQKMFTSELSGLSQSLAKQDVELRPVALMGSGGASDTMQQQQHQQQQQQPRQSWPQEFTSEGGTAQQGAAGSVVPSAFITGGVNSGIDLRA